MDPTKVQRQGSEWRPWNNIITCFKERGVHWVRLGKHIGGEKKGGVFLIKSCWEWFAPRTLSYVRFKTAGSHGFGNTGSSIILPRDLSWADLPWRNAPVFKSCLCCGPVLSSLRDGSQKLSSVPSYMWDLWENLSSGALLDCWESFPLFFTENLLSQLWAVEEMVDAERRSCPAAHVLAAGAGEFSLATMLIIETLVQQ